MTEMLSTYRTPAASRLAGRARVAVPLRKFAPQADNRWAAEAFTALSEQIVVVYGTNAATIVVPPLVAQLSQLRVSHPEVLTWVEELVGAHPLHPP